MKITIEVKTVYGVDQIYPVCEQSKLLAQLAGTKTITRDALNLIKKMGYEVEVKQKDFNL